MTESISRYPLQWPIGWKRTPLSQQNPGKFAKRTSRVGSSYQYMADVTLSEAVQRLLAELQRMAVAEHDVVISTNVVLRLDGLPRSGQGEPTDSGAAVYWRDMGQNRCMAIDRYTKVAQNVAALAATIEAMRAIERHGGASILDRAFTGFTALPAPIVAGMKRHWHDVLDLWDGTDNGATGHMGAVCAADVQRAYRRLASQYHPDRGGDPAKMSELNAARDEALKECK